MFRCGSGRRLREWVGELCDMIRVSEKDFISLHRFDSFVPVRSATLIKWLVVHIGS
jgi:hypothetical protein